MNKGIRNTLLGFVAGDAAGALAIVLAPEKGSKIRKEISQRLKDVSKDINNKFNEAVEHMKNQVNGAFNDMKGKVREAEESIKKKDKVKTSAK